MIQTERLILRPYKMSDLNDYYEYVSQNDVGPRCGWQPYTSIDKARERLEHETKKQYQLAIYLKSENKVIGSIEIHDIKPDRYDDDIDPETTREIGALLHEGYWNKGIMTEAIKAVIKFCFDYLKLERVVAGFYEPNIGSGRMQQKAGMQIIGRTPNYITWYKTNQPCDLIKTMITKRQYLDNPIYKDVHIIVEN